MDTAEWLEQLIAGEHPVEGSPAWVGQDRQGWAAQALDQAYRDFVTNMSANSSVGADERGRLHVERLEAVPDPPNLVTKLSLTKLTLSASPEPRCPSVRVGSVVAKAVLMMSRSDRWASLPVLLCDPAVAERGQACSRRSPS